MIPASEAEPPWDLLSEAERARTGAFRREEDARAFCRTRAFLRRVLSLYLDIPPAAITIDRSADRKPYLPDSPNLAFNLSHSATTTLLALATDQEIGIDVEDMQVLPNLEQIARDVLTEEEARTVLAEEGNERLRLFLRAWTRKEAALKALGKGLHVEPRGFSVPLLASGCWSLPDLGATGSLGHPIKVRDISLDHAIAAVAGRDVGGRLVERVLGPD